MKDESTESSVGSSVDPLKNSIRRVRFFRHLKNFLIFLLGVAVGVGAVVIVLIKMGLIGSSVETAPQVLVDLGELPLPEFSVSYSQISLRVFPVPAAANFPISSVQLSIKQDPSSPEWDHGPLVDFDNSSPVDVVAVGLIPGHPVALRYRLELVDGRHSGDSAVILTQTKSPIAPNPPELHRISATDSSLTIGVIVQKNGLELYGSEITSVSVEIRKMDPDEEPEIRKIIVQNRRRLKAESVANEEDAMEILVDGLSPGRSVNFKAFAENSVGQSIFGNSMDFTTNNVGARPPQMLSIPEVVSNEYGRLTIQWAAAQERGAEVLRYRVSLTDGSSTAVSEQTDQTQITLEGIQPGKLYEFFVIADSGVGPSEPSEVLQVLSESVCVPDTPVGASVRWLWSDALGISWSHPPNPRCPFRILRSRVMHGPTVLCEAEGTRTFCDVVRPDVDDLLLVVVAFNAHGPSAPTTTFRARLPVAETGYEGKCAAHSDGRWFIPREGYASNCFSASIVDGTKRSAGILPRSLESIKRLMTNRCPASMTPLPSDQCFSCFAKSIECNRTVCAKRCAIDPYLDTCLQCDIENCRETFTRCAFLTEELATTQSLPRPVKQTWS